MAYSAFTIGVSRGVSNRLIFSFSELKKRTISQNTMKTQGYFSFPFVRMIRFETFT